MQSGTAEMDVMDVTEVADAAAMMRVLGNPARLAILQEAGPAEVSVSHLADQVDLPQATTSQHLRVLRDGGLVSVRVDGNHRYYRTNQERLSSLSDFLDGLWSRDLAALKAAAEHKHKRASRNAE